MTQKKHIDLPADLDGPWAKAWTCFHKNTRASIAAWLVHAPKAHPFWANYLISVVHLRQETGLPAPAIHYPAAAYEFVIIAIDPKRCPVPDPRQPPWPFLLPHDVVMQFHFGDGVDDHRAGEIVHQAVGAICRGRLSPDQDYRRLWRQWLEEQADVGYSYGYPFQA